MVSPPFFGKAPETGGLVRFVPYRGEEKEENEVYSVIPVSEFPKFRIDSRYIDRKRWAKIARKKGLSPDDQDYVALNETGEAHCFESLVGWEGTETLNDGNGEKLFADWPDGMPANAETIPVMARFLTESLLEVVDEETGKKVFKTLWALVQDGMVKAKTFERKN